MAKKALGEKPPPEPDQSEVRWLISYSDFMMQLVCLFILLYSVSSGNPGKAAAAAAAYRAMKGLPEPPKVREPVEPARYLALGEQTLTGGQLGKADIPKGVRSRIREVPEGWLVDFEHPVFQAGSSELTESSRKMLDEILSFLRAYAGHVVVTGFTAPDPADTVSGDALRLSQDRAAAAVSHLTRGGFERALDPRHVTAVGKGTGDGTQGRRVEILLKVK